MNIAVKIIVANILGAKDAKPNVKMARIYVRSDTMKILNPHYFGLIARCNGGCGAILGYEPNDVSKNQCIKCPQCGAVLWVPFNPEYDGVIKESKNEAMVSK